MLELNHLNIIASFMMLLINQEFWCNLHEFWRSLHHLYMSLNTSRCSLFDIYGIQIWWNTIRLFWRYQRKVLVNLLILFLIKYCEYSICFFNIQSAIYKLLSDCQYQVLKPALFSSLETILGLIQIIQLIL